MKIFFSEKNFLGLGALETHKEVSDITETLELSLG